MDVIYPGKSFRECCFLYIFWGLVPQNLLSPISFKNQWWEFSKSTILSPLDPPFCWIQHLRKNPQGTCAEDGEGNRTGWGKCSKIAGCTIRFWKASPSHQMPICSTWIISKKKTILNIYPIIHGEKMLEKAIKNAILSLPPRIFSLEGFHVIQLP